MRSGPQAYLQCDRWSVTEQPYSGRWSVVVLVGGQSLFGSVVGVFLQPLVDGGWFLISVVDGSFGRWSVVGGRWQVIFYVSGR